MPNDLLSDPVRLRALHHSNLLKAHSQAQFGRIADLVRDMMHGDFDVAILEEAADLPDRLRSWRLFREHYRVLCRTDHRFAQLNAIEPALLDGEVWIEPSGDEVTGSPFDRSVT